MEKKEVKIIQITSCVDPGEPGFVGDKWIFGLGDDGLVYVWDEKKPCWIIWSK